MTYVRKQTRGKRNYYYLVESQREGKKVRQRVLQYLGTSKPKQKEIDRIIKEIKMNQRREVNNDR